jgi:hypothetical protein
VPNCYQVVGANPHCEAPFIEVEYDERRIRVECHPDAQEICTFVVVGGTTRSLDYGSEFAGCPKEIFKKWVQDVVCGEVQISVFLAAVVYL